MPIKRNKPEQIVTMLRQIEVSIANGKTTPQAWFSSAYVTSRGLPSFSLQLRDRKETTSYLKASVATFLFVTRIGAQSSTVETPEANPGRPTVSTPATLTPVGYLQFENGGLYAETSPEFTTLFGINQVTKLTVASRLQLLALSEPLAQASGATGDALSGSRPGEVFAGFQAVVLPGEGHKPTVSLSYIRRLYASHAPEIDIGTFRNSASILLSDDLAGFHFDINGIFSEQTKSIIRRGQFGQTLSISHPLGRLTVAGELWHFTQPLPSRNALGNLWAVSYPVRKNLVVDAGFDHGLTSSSTQWEGFAGFTYLLPHRRVGIPRSKINIACDDPQSIIAWYWQRTSAHP